jgi:hypothetical protein
MTPDTALDEARRAIAVAMLGDEPTIHARLGSVTLHEHQRSAAAKLLTLIAAHGGAMLADPVGVGKTYVALAIAGRYHAVTIVVPAALRDMWTSALAATDMCASLVTHEALSRQSYEATAGDLVVIDEAHRFRNVQTRRYGAAAELCRGRHVLLLTATPIHNRPSDLAAQLALFLGRRAWQLASNELATYVTRTNEPHRSRGLPELSGPHRVTLATGDDWLDDLAALPPPVPASDEGVAAALGTYALVHQWASSRAALVASLKRQLARALALIAAVDDGRMPTRSELAAWSFADDAMQLAFPGLVVFDAEPVDAATIRAALDVFVDSARRLLRRLSASTDPDIERANVLRDIRDRHRGERIIAFAQYAETVNALGRCLSRENGVAILTARGARVAGGPISRRELLSQFMPREAAIDVPIAERIELLLTTDLLSEGLNLQEASVIVHLDLPWNPARLDQRVGRVRRLGSRFETISVYTFSPPATADRLLHLEQRLREKLCVARQTIGVAGHILPPLLGEQTEATVGVAEQWGAVRLRLRRWNAPARERTDPAIAAVVAAHDGFIACALIDGVPHLVVERDGRLLTDADVVRASVDVLECAPRTVNENSLARARRKLEHWIAEQRGSATIDLKSAAAARARRETLARVSRALARAPRHRRAIIAPLADAARATATAPLGEGAERVLDMLARSELPDEAWLRSIVAFGELNIHQRDTESRDDRLIALILFQRGD